MILNLESAINIITHQYHDRLEATRISEPDPNWRAIDAAGHEHRYSRGKNPYPTLLAIRRRGMFEDGMRYWYIHHYKCRRCREWVYPGYKTPDPTFVRGIRQWSAEATFETSFELMSGLTASIYANKKIHVLFPHGLEKDLWVTDVSFDDRVIKVGLRE